MEKRLYQAFCWRCNCAVGRVRKYHDSAVEEAAGHEVKNMDCRTSIISSFSRPCMKLEMEILRDRENQGNQCGRRHDSTIAARLHKFASPFVQDAVLNQEVK